jgi:hypothetical protein
MKLRILILAVLTASFSFPAVAGQTNFVFTATGGSTNQVAWAPSGNWSYVFIRFEGTARVAINEAATASSPVVVSNTVWTVTAPDPAPKINVVGTGASCPIHINAVSK